jgi:hypothetical protein
MNVYRGYTKPTRGVPHVITSCAGWRRHECVPRVHKATPSVDITTDIFAIPGFLALVVYFSQIPNKSAFEVIMLCFSSAGLIADIFFT